MLVDANLLLFAVNEAASQHRRAREWLVAQLNGSRRVGLPWQVLGGFLRIATHPRAFERPLSAEQAWGHVARWLDAPVAWIPEPGPRYADLLGGLIAGHDLRANLIPDAQLAALALENGVAIASADTDFARFGEVRWENPLPRPRGSTSRQPPGLGVYGPPTQDVGVRRPFPVGDTHPMPTEHVDVLIVGAGLSGIGTACHLQERSPRKSFAILEARDAIGGTWDLFRYPGIRSDSDMFTLGYNFRPWPDGRAIADGPSIRTYVRETARDHGIENTIRFHHRVVRAEWSTDDAHWTVTAQRTDTGETVELTCGFLFGATGYYRYDEGYLPHFEGTDRFRGEIVHPQHWPEDLDYTGKRVVVIGSGATAVTLVPALAERAEHVTMLQRSPSYVITLPAIDPIAEVLTRRLPPKLAYALVRWKNVLMTMGTFNLSRRAPDVMRKLIRRGVQRHLPDGYDVDTHFNPRYNPWDQRLCLVPDSDLFKVLSSGDASIVTDGIETFTESGLQLSSGAELEADVIVTATGLNLLLLGGIEMLVDGEEVDLSQRIAYKGMMLSGVPNLAIALGYTNASWTLKCDLVAQYACRLINHMDEHGYASATPKAPDPSLPTEPFIDFSSGYVLRSIADLPKQGATAPWRLHQNYFRDVRLLRHGPLDDAMEFERAGERVDLTPA